MNFLHKFKVSNDIKILSKEKRFDGFFSIVEYVFKHRKFNGEWTEKLSREVFERGDAVAVLPYDRKTDSVLLVEQCRIGAIAALDNANQRYPKFTSGNSPSLIKNQNPWLLECLAGIVDAGETPEQVAIREAKEEANLNIHDVQLMTSYLSSPGGISERIFLYLALTDLRDAGGVHGLASEHEDIRSHVFKREDALALMAQGTIDNAATLIALQWLALNHATLKP